MPKFTREELKERAFKRAACVIREMWEERGSSDTRLLQEPLIPDDFVIVGESINGRHHKEHVVPRMLICDESHKMFAQGASVEEVAKFIQRNLKIVLIAKTEQTLLDKSTHLNLRQSMPDSSWLDGGDIYARLRVAGIFFRFY